MHAGVAGLFFEALLKLSHKRLDVIGDQARGQAASYAAERHVRDGQQPQRFEGSLRALEQVRAASERTRRYREDVGCEVRRDVRDRRLVYLRDVASRLETVPVFHTRRLSLIRVPGAGGISQRYIRDIHSVYVQYRDSGQNSKRGMKEQHRRAPAANRRSDRVERRSRDASLSPLAVGGRSTGRGCA